MILIGLTGSPAAGKSTVADLLTEEGADWVNADLIARECLNEPQVSGALADRFGQSVIDLDGRVNRKVLAGYVFGDEPEKQAALAFLESLVHPKTREVILDRIVAASDLPCPAILLDVPLLFESGWDLACDLVWCVTSSWENRVERATKRGWSAADLARREARQLSIEEKCRLSNRVMRNDATLEALREIVLHEWESIGRINGRKTADFFPTDLGHCLSDHQGSG